MFVLIGDKVFWSDYDAPVLKMANIDGSNIVTLDATVAYARDIVVYYNYLYFVETQTDHLYRIRKDGSSSPEAVSINDEHFSSPRGLHIEFCKFRKPRNWHFNKTFHTI